MAGMLPANLSFFMSRLQGVSTSQLRLNHRPLQVLHLIRLLDLIYLAILLLI